MWGTRKETGDEWGKTEEGAKNIMGESGTGSMGTRTILVVIPWLL